MMHMAPRGDPMSRSESAPNSGPSQKELATREADPAHIVACVQNIGNKYSSVAVLNLLFGNDIITGDEEFNRLADEAVRMQSNSIFKDCPEDTVRSIYQDRVQVWNHTVRHLALADTRARLPTSILDPGSNFYVDGFLVGPWSTFSPCPTGSAPTGDSEPPRQPGFPTRALSKQLHPLVRRVLSFFTLPLNGSRTKNLGYSFCCFRTRPLLDRFRVLLSAKRVSWTSPKRLQIAFARVRTLEEVRAYFRYEAKYHQDGSYWFDEEDFGQGPGGQYGGALNNGNSGIGNGLGSSEVSTPKHGQGVVPQAQVLPPPGDIINVGGGGGSSGGGGPGGVGVGVGPQIVPSRQVGRAGKGGNTGSVPVSAGGPGPVVIPGAEQQAQAAAAQRFYGAPIHYAPPPPPPPYYHPVVPTNPPGLDDTSAEKQDLYRLHEALVGLLNRHPNLAPLLAGVLEQIPYHSQK